MTKKAWAKVVESLERVSKEFPLIAPILIFSDDDPRPCVVCRIYSQRGMDDVSQVFFIRDSRGKDLDGQFREGFETALDWAKYLAIEAGEKLIPPPKKRRRRNP